jgi:hypothetical protein
MMNATLRLPAPHLIDTHGLASPRSSGAPGRKAGFAGYSKSRSGSSELYENIGFFMASPMYRQLSIDYQ